MPQTIYLQGSIGMRMGTNTKGEVLRILTIEVGGGTTYELPLSPSEAATVSQALSAEGPGAPPRPRLVIPTPRV